MSEPSPNLDEWTQSFGPLLRAAREDAGLSRSKLARMLDMPEQNVKNWESGRSLPSLPHYLRLRRALPDLAMPSYRSGKRKRTPIVEPRQLPMVTIAH